MMTASLGVILLSLVMDVDWAIVLVFVVLFGIIAYLVTGYLVTNNKLKAPFLRPAQIFYYSVSAVILLFIVGAILYGGVNHYFNDSGWYPRTREVDVYAHVPNWVTGEFKTCYSTSTKENDELKSLYCASDVNESHTLSVRFWGPITTEREKTWKCEREPMSLTCSLK